MAGSFRFAGAAVSRIRTVKPDFFKHEALFDAEQETGLPLRIAFIGLWTVADKEGRFAWRPRPLKTDILPYDSVDFSRVLDALATRGFIVQYASKGELFGYIPSWKRHQVINNRESASVLPDPVDSIEETDASATREPRDTDLLKGKGREGKGKGNSETIVSGADAPNVVVFDARKALFDDGLTVLSKLSGKPVDKCRSLVGRWLKATNDDAQKVRATILRAAEQDVAEAVSWIEASLATPPADWRDDPIYRNVQ